MNSTKKEDTVSDTLGAFVTIIPRNKWRYNKYWEKVNFIYGWLKQAIWEVQEKY